MIVLLVIIVVLTWPILFLRWRAMWIWVNWLCMLLAWCVIQLPDTTDISTSFEDEFEVKLVGYLATLVVAAVVLRTITMGAREVPLPPVNWPKPLLLLNGIGWALIVFAVCFHELGGSPHAVRAHVTLAGIGVAVGVTGLFYRHIFPIGVAIGLIASTGYSTVYPLQVNHAARDAAQGGPYCIYLSEREHFSRNNKDLTLLTMDKSTWHAHAVLIIDGPDGPVYGHWSYWKGQFVVPWRLHIRRPTLQCPH